MVDSTEDRRIAPRVEQPSLRVTLIGADYEPIGDLVSVNASGSGLLLASAGSTPIPVEAGSQLEGAIWDTERPGTVPFRARVVRVEPEDGPVERVALQLTWIEPASYITFQQLVYDQPIGYRR